MASIPSEAIPDLQRLGERLRQAREQQGLSREELAERLRLGTEQLVALETADSGRLHEPVFVIAQARRLAAALNLGIEPEIIALRRCGMGHGPAATPAPAPAPAAAPTRNSPVVPQATPTPAPRTTPRSWRPWVAGTGLAVVALLALAVLRRPPAPTSPRSAEPVTGPRTPRSTGDAGLYSLQALRSGESSWVEVRDASGRVLFRGGLEGRKSFPIGDGLQVLAGRPDLVAGGMNGAEPQPLGAIDQVSWRRIPAAPALARPAAGTPTPPAR